MEPCKAETQNDEMLALLLKWGYKRCPRCGHGTRRMFGCSHMQCLCGAHWCWGCERSFLECEREGGCDWDEDEDDDEMSEDDNEENSDEIGLAGMVAEASMNADVVMTDPATEGDATVGAERGENNAVGNVAPPRPLTPIVQAESAQAERLQRPRHGRNGNLDARGARYWQIQDLDFGAEPGDADDRVWGCQHEWTIPAGDTKMWDEDGMDCHECWDEIKDKGHGWFCDRCGLLACGKCAGKGKEKAKEAVTAADGSSSS
jgi:hypothetical protein